jgi:hypothetical protein
MGNLSAIVRELGQTGIVGRAQGFGVHHGIEVPHRRPGGIQPHFQLLQRYDEFVPTRVFRQPGQPFGQRRPVLGQDGVDRRFDMLRQDAAESGQGVGGKQRIGHGDSLQEMVQ